MSRFILDWIFKVALIALGVYLVVYVGATIFMMYADLAAYH